MDFLLENGDLSISDTFVKEAHDKVFLKQCAECRIKSVKIDWFADNIGADLEEIVGLPNTKETGEQAKTKIKTSLTEDGLFLDSEIEINLYPTSKTAITFNVVIDREGVDRIEINAALDLVKGVEIWGSNS